MPYFGDAYDSTAKQQLSGCMLLIIQILHLSKLINENINLFYFMKFLYRLHVDID